MQESRGRIGPVIVLVGGILALFGTYWDDAWHTDRGRDSFFVPPHLLLYSGVLLAGVGVGLWALQLLLTTRSLRSVFRSPPLMLAAFGTAATVVSAPIDEAWHQLFGRDAVLWSPPHLLGVSALLCVAVGTLLELGLFPGKNVRSLAMVAAALVIGTLMVPVMEYETDVPQFALRWYLPVLTGCLTFAFGLIERRGTGQWRITTAAIIYTIMRMGILGFLLILDHSTAIIPPLVLPALVFDLTARFTVATPIRAALLASSVALGYGLYGRIVPGGLILTLADLLIGLPVALGLSWALLALAARPRWQTGVRPIVVGVGLAMVIITPTTTSAHDPGQGEDVGQVAMVAVPNQNRVAVTVTIMEHTHGLCADTAPLAVVGRRAGITVRGPLQRRLGCEFTGDIMLDAPGRWFVYTEWQHGADGVESWLPVQIGVDAQRTSRISSLYRPAQQSGSAGQRSAAIMLYSINATILGIILWVVRRTPQHSVQAGSAA